MRKAMLTLGFVVIFGLMTIGTKADNCSIDPLLPVDAGSETFWAGDTKWMKIYAIIPEGKLYAWAEPNVMLLSKPDWIIEHELVVDDYNNAPIHLRSYCDGELLNQEHVRLAYRIVEVRTPLFATQSFVQYYIDDGQGAPDSRTQWQKNINVLLHRRPFTDAVVSGTKP